MKREQWKDLWSLLLLLFGSIFMIAPFIWTISTSLKDRRNVFEIPPQWIPDPITFSNYERVWLESPLLYGFMNSLIIVVIVLTVGMLVSAMAAYAFGKFEFPYKGVLFLGLLGTMMIPYSVVMIPQYIGFSRLDWVDTLLPLIVPGLFGNIVVIFFIRQYLQSALPTELIEAAKIDGCSFPGIFFKIALPTMKPALAAQAALGFMGIWNDFLGPLIYLHTPEKQTIQVLIASMQAMYIGQSDYPMIMAAAVIAMLPVIVVFFFCQRYFIESMAISGIKG
ncbi:MULTISPECIES: carbohydrate ABC transporter permease [Paenibacillus]|uniref:ABC transporter permease subunit n=1 Tax=Paenibacillus campinasensis TaxID=66347 RepID=A0A268EQ25_9BACL|nr:MULTISPECIES: carbohydrate ABC transporter permease [Paenibacillus]MUG66859.1 ABC transporter permease subunit [Paenibacillus campinasensis]PAD75230.1 sugar ABC transporter permease [Paenibacillus campinasensis]PAK55872.1 sugar ABC transporter permease [Paenibacillus sp. 7541]